MTFLKSSQPQIPSYYDYLIMIATVINAPIIIMNMSNFPIIMNLHNGE